ncbi:MAG: C40 family peptidase [Clostridiales bacterium]|nr:C40 family peptidase [Clostridiales bacterium]
MNIKINRTVAFFIALTLVLLLCACGGAGDNKQQNSPDAAPAGSTDGGGQQEPPITTASDSPDAGNGDTDDGGAGIDTPPQVETSAEAPPTDSGGGEETTVADGIVSLAQSLIGAAYEWGAAGPDTFDNSGFVYYCFRENGVNLPRKTSEMFLSGMAVEQEDLLPGDLVFFTYNEDRSASYVGIFMGGGQFIAENNEDRPVSIHDMTLDYYKKIYVGARRYF